MSACSAFRMVAVAAALAAFPLGSNAWAQSRSDFQQLQARVNQLEAAVGAMRGQAGGGAPGSAAQLELRLAALEEEIRNMTGKIEEASYKAKQVDDRVTNLQEDTEFRLNRLEQAAGVQAGSAGPGPSVGPGPGPAIAAPAPREPAPGAMAMAEPPASAPPPGNGPPPSRPAPNGMLGADSSGALDAYDHALGLLRQGDYDRAEAALKGFLANYPGDRLAGNAQYWLAETYYVRGAYDQAAQTFLSGIQTYPNGAKVPDSFLKLGMSLVLMGEKDRGCKVLSELPSRYPDASTAIRGRAERERQAAGCN